MDYKLKNLKDKIYRNFIKGVYGDPKIPNKDEVLDKILELTSLDANPISKNIKLDDLDISSISKQFTNTIDDIDILFASIEDESSNILDQLTNSLKEHNGIKREVQRINERADDISSGKLGEDYLRYTFTENFNSLSNIDSFKSDQIDLKARQFTIKRNSSKVLTLSHYDGSKLEFSVVQNFAKLEDYGYVGTSDAGVLLDPNDPRSLTYRIKTNNITPLKVITSLQLTATGESVEINSVSLDIDSRTNKGQIRIYYRGANSAWRDITPISIKDIKGDRVVFNFDPVLTSHLKFEFIKPVPDIASELEYLIILRSISITKATSVNSAAIQSNPIILQSYSKEHPIVDNLKVLIDMEQPEGTSSQLFVAKDILVSGAFKDSNNTAVAVDSPNIYSFDSQYTDTVFLSDLKSVAATVSGAAIYKGLDYDWIELKDYDTTGGIVSTVVGFNLSDPVETMDNSIFVNGEPKYLFGDSRYTGPWPQTSGADWYYSGWCNTDNAWWNPYLSDLVDSGILVSGVDIALLSGIPYDEIEDQFGNLHPDISGSLSYSGQWLGYGSGTLSGIGYPFGWENSDAEVLKFGEYFDDINGWWRPAAEGITMDGLSSGYINVEDNSLLNSYRLISPDFYFNGANYWKIYKFGTGDKVITSSIRLYTYQERPIFGTSRYYPHNFTWKYKSSWDIKTGSILEQSDPIATGFVGYTIDISSLFSDNEEYIFDGISEIKVHNTNVILDSNIDYTLTPISSVPTTIDLSRLAETKLNLVPQGASFDIKYSYKSKNKYESTWTSYAIVSASTIDPTLTIPNIEIFNKEGIPIISKIDVENLDTGEIQTVEATEDLFVVRFNNTSADRSNIHFKLTIYCASDESSGFCAKYNSLLNWVPYHSTSSRSISVSAGVKLVNSLTSLAIVDLGSLVYDSSLHDVNKAAIYSDNEDDKFLVVEQASRDKFQGYYFDSITRSYVEYPNSKILNRGHWVRRGYSANNSGILNYTTGSSGVSPGIIYNTEYDSSIGREDTSWNNGSCLDKYPNSVDKFLPAHTTFGYPINIDDEVDQVITKTLYTTDVDPRAPTLEQGYIGTTEHAAWLGSEFNQDWIDYTSHGKYSIDAEVSNKGFLYYNTAENLSTYYSISYKVIPEENANDSRFLYKMILSSDNDSNLMPVVNSLKFVTNEE